ncbi:2,3-bisphosphoglycerate-independent phosphoglycerate mutase [Thermospira aquatica]|uniref:2,3-bisphosphoglycerate-independent phosphoglycerate mutase n=1 Tax=Thermospira aquatica TaxID=2828656 RepID=A0AAX3BBQ6_9SPIR|nr:2,3-bisphosphoglycerate-independent phosphoglycerate mutase [Thermospira aquatica]URA09665.1 2,3-bisphosphoglycerate-independent phosphoglycerate mutase [Thermospira aquatica]
MSLTLKPLENFHSRSGPVLLVIMDGIGLGKPSEGNAVYKAKTPVLDELFKMPLYTELQAHGTAVGLPSDDDMGNSEVGHNALGAGRVFSQGAKRVNEAIADGSIFQTEVWKSLVRRCTEGKGTFHFIGLLSDGNVHSHIDHLIALLRHAAKEGVKRARIHTLLDGRDVPEKSALIYIDKLEGVLKELKAQGFDYRIASGGGRMVTTMDRYFADWNIVKRGWDAHVLGKGRMFSSAREAVETYYAEDPKITDQYLPSFVVAENGKPVGTIEDGDSVVLFNFRGDRAIEISMAFEYKDFDKFDRERYPEVMFAGMMQYDGDLKLPSNFLVQPPVITRTVSEYMCAAGIKSFAISETQKFGHVTYFWNGNRSGYIDEKLETYIEIPSDKIQFDKAPAMKANEITEKTIELLRTGEYKFGRLNFANGDMVGHTGVMEAAIEAVETVDRCVGQLLDEVKKMNGIVVVTADHGNADEMFTEKNGKREVKTAHTLNKVPFIIVDYGYQNEYHIRSLPKAGLSNVAATLLNLLGYKKPEDYDPSLIEF